MSKWPKKVKHRNKVLAKIYRPCQGRDSYRVAWTAAGRRMMKSFPTFSGPGGAKEYAEALVKELAKQSQAIMLTPTQANDALAAIERINTFHQSTGRRVSLLAAVSEYCEAATKLRGQGRPVPARCSGRDLEADRSVREQFDAWLASHAEKCCKFSDQALRRREVHMTAPFETWTIEPRFACCLQCGLEGLSISPDEAHASFGNFVVDPPGLQQHLDTCRAFAAAPKGVLLLLGNCGTGKTHLAVAILRELLRREVSDLMFVKHRHFLAEHWRALRPVPFGQEPPESPLTRCQESALLVYDELTPTPERHAYEDVLLDLFEFRIGRFKPSIITANVNRAELETTLGTRLYDRLRRAVLAVLEFGFESKRPNFNADYLSRIAKP